MCARDKAGSCSSNHSKFPPVRSPMHFFSMYLMQNWIEFCFKNAKLFTCRNTSFHIQIRASFCWKNWPQVSLSCQMNFKATFCCKLSDLSGQIISNVFCYGWCSDSCVYFPLRVSYFWLYKIDDKILVNLLMLVKIICCLPKHWICPYKWIKTSQNFMSFKYLNIEEAGVGFK